MVDPDRVRLEVAQRESGGHLQWEAFGPGSVVRTPYGDLVVNDLYAALEASAST